MPVCHRLLVVVCLLFTSAFTDHAVASGLLMDRRGGTALELVSHRVDVTIDDQIARTHVSQVFRNDSARMVEAIYLFPVPEGAGVSDFAMWIDGDRRPAVIAERQKAVRVYESIVRKKRDPALLEQIGKSTFRMRVFPVLPNSETKIELSYDEVLTTEGHVCRYRLPLKMDQERASTLTEDFTVSVRIRSMLPVGAIESTTHAIDVIRTDREIVVGTEKMGATLDQDFELTYRLDVDELSMTVAAQRAADEDGTFLVLLNPGLDDDADVLQKDVILVMDTSGSMGGTKIITARRAMRRFVESLRPGDRFNVLTFSTGVRRFESGLVPVNEETCARAMSFIDDVAAAGGTAIDAALGAALGDAAAARPADPETLRPVRIVFVSDGDPTVGERDPKAIIKNAIASNGADARIFAFGVESKIDGVLLNNLAARTGGTADRVTSSADLESVLVDFLARIARPVLSNITAHVEGAGAYDLEPRTPPDLFAGGQVQLVGRYRQPGPARITIRATYRGRPHELVGTFDLPALARGDAALRRLWAKRKIEFLQDELWWNGDAKELRDEIVQLSLEERILTPYTAMLVLETDEDYRSHGFEVPKRSKRELAAAESSAAEAWSSTTEFKGRIADGGPGGPGAGPGSGPSTPGAGPVTGGGFGGKKNKPGAGFEQWPFWLEHNAVQSGGSAFLTGLGRKEVATTSRRPTLDQVHSEIVPTLRDALSSGDPEIVDSAVLALGKVVGAADADQVLADIVGLVDSPHKTVRESAILSLGVLGSAFADAALLKIMTNADRSDLDRAFAATSLGAIGSPESVDPLMDVILTEPNSSVDVRSMAILALGQFTERRDEIVTFLVALLGEKKFDRTAVAQIPISLSRLGAPAKRALPTLMALAAARRTDIRMAESCVLAVGALADGDDAAARTLLMLTIGDSKNQQARHFAFIALGRLAGRACRDEAGNAEMIDACTEFLLKELNKPKTKTHQPWAGLALAELATELRDSSSRRVQVMTRLSEAFEDSNNPSYKGAFAIALGRLNARAAGEMLFEEFLDTLDTSFRRYLAKSLMMMRHTDSLTAMRGRFANATNARVKKESLAVLATMGDPEALPILIDRLVGASSDKEAAWIAESIGCTRNSVVVPHLRAMVEDPKSSSRARAYACVALGILAEKTNEPWSARWADGTNYRTVVPALYEILDIL